MFHEIKLPEIWLHKQIFWTMFQPIIILFNKDYIRFERINQDIYVSRGSIKTFHIVLDQ